MADSHVVRLLRQGHTQAILIPPELELAGESARIHREGSRLVIEPVRKEGILDLLARLEPIDEEFPDFDAGLPPARTPDL